MVFINRTRPQSDTIRACNRSVEWLLTEILEMGAGRGWGQVAKGTKLADR